MIKYIFLFLIAISYLHCISQGCSDAGVCTADPKLYPHLFQNDSTPTPEKNKIRFRSIVLETGYGVGDRDVSIISTALKIDIALKKKWSIQLKLPYTITNGKLGSLNGFGDPSFFIHKLIIANKLEIGLLGGFKIPGNGSQLPETGFPLPMAYQTSLGTVDGIGLVKFSLQNISLSIGYQHPFTSTNTNNFTHNAWKKSTVDSVEYLAFPETQELKRSPDLILKLEYSIAVKKLIITPGVLPVLHLSEDSYGQGAKKNIAGSQGLTFNIITDLRYLATEHVLFSLSGGFPVIARKVRPDGLTRHYQINFSVGYLF